MDMPERFCCYMYFAEGDKFRKHEVALSISSILSLLRIRATVKGIAPSVSKFFP